MRQLCAKSRKFKLFANFMGTLEKKKNRPKTRGKELVNITQPIGMKAKKFFKAQLVGRKPTFFKQSRVATDNNAEHLR